MARARKSKRKPRVVRLRKARVVRLRKAPAKVFVEHEQRVRLAERLHVKQWRSSQICAELMRKFKVAERTAKEDLRLARQLLAEADADDRPHRKRALRASFQAVHQEALAAGDLQVATRTLIELGRLDGHYDPKRIEIGGTVGIAVTQQLVVDALDDAGLAALDVVLAQLEAAGVALLPPGGGAPIDVAIADELATADVSKLS